MFGNLGAFLFVAGVWIVTPGPDTALTIRNALFGGRRGGILTAAGVATGQVTWAVAASTGLAALLQASAPAFLAIRLAGAAYLVYLGAHSLARALRRRDAPEPHSGHPRGRPGARAAFRQGLICNLGNPKMAVFVVSLLPQFTPTGHASFAALLVLGLLFSAMTFVWLTGYAVLIGRAGVFFRRRMVARLLDALTGVVLIALGGRVATERN
jgi:threonine/homoserine/homoserine lactone efflux protein